MWQEVYYEHYVENCRERYWEEEKQLPYPGITKPLFHRSSGLFVL